MLQQTMTEWLASAKYVPSEELPGFVICVQCACPVLAGEEERHTQSVHGFRL